MTPTPISQDHTGQWRPVNPYPEKILKNTSKDGKSKVYQTDYRYTLFEKQITYYPFPDAPETKQGEVVMARLQWQGWNGKEWIDLVFAGISPLTRQIWVVVTDSAKEEEAIIDYQERIDKLKNQISHYKSQSDEMLALKQQKERELESLQQKYNEGLL